MTAVKEQAEENIRKSQEKQKEAYSRKVMKKFKNLKYSIGDEVLLCNMRKHGRKGGRIEADFSGPYMIQAISGRLVTLSTSQGATLKNKYNINHIKPYRRSASTDVRDQTGPVPSKVDITKTSDVFPEICPLPSTNQQSERPSVIQFCGKMPAEHTDTDKQVDNTVAEVQEMDHIPPKINRSIQQEGLIGALTFWVFGSDPLVKPSPPVCSLPGGDVGAFLLQVSLLAIFIFLTRCFICPVSSNKSFFGFY